MNRMRYGVVLVALGLAVICTANAQAGGQFCVRNYADDNGNGLLDADERVLNSGVGVELLNSNNIVVASTRLQDSPNAELGIVCFQGLVDGRYSVLVAATDYRATTTNLFTQTVSASAVPVVVEFGGQPLDVPAASEAAGNSLLGIDLQMSPAAQRQMIARVAVSTVGAGFVVIVMALAGVVVFQMRQRRRATPLRPVTYQNTSVRQMDEIPGGAPTPIKPNDTNPMRRIVIDDDLT
ncbi:MAG: hypothetical protein ACOYL5_09220 [Phototrophicaceae bacterium]|jgi:hypothetical protein